MNIGWIAPIGKKCGISIYAKRYADVLKHQVTCIQKDPQEYVDNKSLFLESMSNCEVIHIQYEPSFFMQDTTSFFYDLCNNLPGKKVVSLHEVYSEIPNVFPRDKIDGIWPLKAIKQAVWDKKHSHWASYNAHMAKGFFADELIVHSEYQKKILIDNVVAEHKIIVLPFPVVQHAGTLPMEFSPQCTVTLGAAGFINPSYDYKLLFSVLEKLTIYWRFVWIGGARREEDRGLLEQLQKEIETRGWKDKFIITNWVEDDEHEKLLKQIDLYCAFFKHRSSSESLADAIGAKRLILATRIPLTEELVSMEPLAVLCENDADKMAKRLYGILADEPLRRTLMHATSEYGKKYNYERNTHLLVDLYERLTCT